MSKPLGSPQAARANVGTPIEPGLIARAVSGVRYALTGIAPDAWMGPGTPPVPGEQSQKEAAGRQFDFAPGINTRQSPRANEAISFSDLRALADGYDLVRLVIETRKDQMTKQKFKIVPINDAVKPDARCAAIETALRFPDLEHSWDDWLRMVLEDMLVLDAATIYPRMTNGGALYALEPVDGATIKRVIDSTGRTPIAPDPAYQQVLKGVPAVDYSRDELIYKPRNLRTHKLYGYSPVEQIINTINVALRRQLYQLQYFTEGSVPDLIMQVPPEWNPDQIKQFSMWWQSLLSGNTAARSKAMFVPSGVKPVDTKDKALTDAFDEWIARVVCYAFSISPQAFVKEVNKATAGTAKDTAIEEGLMPIMNWVKNLMDSIIVRYFNAPDLCLAWAEEKDHDPLQQAQINQIYVGLKVLAPSEIRTDIGRDPMTPEQLEEVAPPPPPPVMPGAPGAPAPTGKGKGNPTTPSQTSQEAADNAAKAQKKSPYASRPLTASALR